MKLKATQNNANKRTIDHTRKLKEIKALNRRTLRLQTLTT